MIARGVEFALGAGPASQMETIRQALIAVGRTAEEAEKEAREIVGRMKTQQELADVRSGSR